MRRAFKYLVLAVSSVFLQACGGKVEIPADSSFLKPLQERDSVLVADQLLYGFSLSGVEEGTSLILPQIKDSLDKNIMCLSPWILDTVAVSKSHSDSLRMMDITGTICISPFWDGVYELPPIELQRLTPDGTVDTLVFDPIRLEVKTMPVDTATFVPHDIKGQVRYPVTFNEIAPWLLSYWVLALAVILTVCLMILRRRKNDPAYIHRDPAHIIALRKLDGYRGSSYWAPQKQKEFYSGVTDALREYISERYGIGAMEMTTSEIFAGMKGTDAPKDVMADAEELFTRADLVKFAKYVASEEENSSSLPVAVRFITQTYQVEIELETENEGGKE